MIYTRDAEADRAFFRDVLGYPYVDTGGGWLIFKLPPTFDTVEEERRHRKKRLAAALESVRTAR